MVAFGERIAEAMSRAPSDLRNHYIAYASLKEVLGRPEQLRAGDTLAAQISAGGEETDPCVGFLRIVSFELERVANFVRQSRTSIETTLARIHFSLCTANLDLEASGRDAEAAGTAIVELDRFARINIMAMKKIIKKFDKVSGGGAAAKTWLDERLAKEGFSSPPPLDAALFALSDVLSLLRQRRGDEAAGGEWVPPTDFERNTTKYWVKPEDLMPVMHAVLRHLPVLAMHRPPAAASGKSTANLLLRAQSREDSSIRGAITSLYLDSADLSHYRERLAREDGARLHRLRWYGLKTTAEDGGGEAVVFVERKTHHAKWTGEKSVKERLPLDALAVGPLLRGACDVREECARLVARGKLRASEADKATAIGCEMQDAVAKQGLRPAVRTVYQRCAFQRSDSNAVRITLDSHLTMVKEGPYGGEDGRWCRPLDASLSREDVVHFPFAVLEVKLQCETPAWVEELITAGLATPAGNFSKYLTGCAALHRAEVRALPAWFDEPSLQTALRLDAAPGATPEESPPSLVSERSAQWRQAALGQSPVGQSRSLKRSGTKLVWSATEPTDTTDFSDGGGGSGTREIDSDKLDGVEQTAPLSLANGISCSATDDAVPDGAVALEIKPEEHAPAAIAGRRLSTRAHTATATPHGSPRAVNAARPWPAVRLWSFSANKTVPKRGVAKVDPKTFFALERTFIQWLSVGMLLFTIGVALMETAERGSLSPGGLVVLASSAMLILYGLTNFYRRVRKLSQRDSSGYVDRCGPAILAAMLLGAAATYVVVYTLKRNEQGGGGAALCALSTYLAAATDLLAQDEFREAAAKLDEAGLPLAGLQGALPDTSLINSLLEAAGVQPPGARLAIINALRASGECL